MYTILQTLKHNLFLYFRTYEAYNDEAMRLEKFGHYKQEERQDFVCSTYMYME